MNKHKPQEMAVTLAVHSQYGGTESRRKIKGSRRDQLDDVSLTPSSEDPLRILAPGQKKLSTIESQRVLAVMEEAIKRMNSAMLIPMLAKSLDRYSITLGAELVELLKEYSRLIKDYNAVYSDLEQQGRSPSLDSSVPDLNAGSITSLPSSARLRLEPLDHERNSLSISTDAKFQQTRVNLKHTIKCILRELHRNPSATSLHAPPSPSTGPSKSTVLLQEEMSNLRDIIHGKLLTTHMEEARKEEHLKDVTQRQKLAEEQITKLEAELAEEQRKKEDLLTKKNNELKRLKSTIKGVVNLAEDRNRRVKVDAHNQQVDDKQVHESKAKALKEEISTVRKKLQDQTAEHREKEQVLRKRAVRREMELENWIKKYDNEIGEKQDEMETLGEEFNEETAQLRELEEKLQVLTLEYDVVVQEQEEARKRAEESAIMIGKMARAARVIQRGWKIYMEKKKAEKKKKKGKKKGKKGKKGKGKGKGKGKKK